jgi:5-methylcytosine-specific restriction endonuclease McrA
MSYVPSKMRELAVTRAGSCCEYCRVSQEHSDLRFHAEHIIAVSHGSKTVETNLALSCPRCNLYKGTHIAAADPITDEPTFLFHPRRHR